MSALNPISAIANIVGSVASVLQLFGVGEGGQKDRLNRISDATGFMAWAFDTGGMRIAALDTAHYLDMILGSFNVLNFNVAAIWELVNDIRDGVRSSPAQMGGGGGGNSIVININGYNGDPQALAAEVSRQLMNNYAFQGF